MLVLSLKRDEPIIIGGKIRVVVCGIRGDKVRIGVEAPQEVGIYRDEIVDILRQEGLDPALSPMVQTRIGQGEALAATDGLAEADN